MATDQERRYLPTDFELRAKGDKGATLVGYAAKFDRYSDNLGGFVERIKPKAFSGVLEDPNVHALFNHDSNLVLGRSGAGTLRLAEDDTGLHYEVDLPNTTTARDLRESLERGDVNKSSFSFQVTRDGEEWGETDQKFPLRDLTRISRLFDVSPVTTPAYQDTESGLRSLAMRSLAKARNLEVETVVRAADEGRLLSVVRGEVQPSEPDDDEAWVPLAQRRIPVTPALRSALNKAVNDRAQAQESRRYWVEMLAFNASVSVEAVRGVLGGTTQPKAEWLESFARSLDVPVATFLDLAPLEVVTTPHTDDPVAPGSALRSQQLRLRHVRLRAPSLTR